METCQYVLDFHWKTRKNDNRADTMERYYSITKRYRPDFLTEKYLAVKTLCNVGWHEEDAREVLEALLFRQAVFNKTASFWRKIQWIIQLLR